MRYRKKPVVIEAEQTSVARAISTLEGVMQAHPGDWIITGVKGEIYPCRDDIFRETYEPAEDHTTHTFEGWCVMDGDKPMVHGFMEFQEGATPDFQAMMVSTDRSILENSWPGKRVVRAKIEIEDEG